MEIYSLSRISVTGSSGFIGSLLCRVLNVQDTHQFDIVTGRDITDEVITDQICQRSDIVIHLGAVSGIANCDKNRTEASATNTEATINLAHKLRETGCHRLIFASSSAVYGEAQQYVMDELHPTDPRNHYGHTKLLAEEIIGLASINFQIIVIRPSNIYGYGMTWKENTVISAFLKAYLENRPIIINGSGSQKRDFVHIMDITHLYARLATAPNVRSGIYNIGGNETISMRALAELVNDIGETVLGYRVPIEFKLDSNETMYHDFRYSSDRAKHTFQYEPIFQVKDFIKERLLIHLRRA